MEQQINAKLNELKALAPENREYKTWLAESNLWGWLYTDYKIQGQKVSRAAVVDMFNGVIREDIPLANYDFAQRCKALYSDMQEDLSMRSAPNQKMLKRWMNILFGDIRFRKCNPVIFEFGLIPCHYQFIEEELDNVIKEYVQCGGDQIEAVAMLFLKILRIYPYEEESVGAAMVMALYCLEGLGLPIPEIPLSEEEFCELITAYMDKGQSQPFCDMFKRCVFNRLDAVLMLAKQAKENEDN